MSVLYATTPRGRPSTSGVVVSIVLHLTLVVTLMRAGRLSAAKPAAPPPHVVARLAFLQETPPEIPSSPSSPSPAIQPAAVIKAEAVARPAPRHVDEAAPPLVATAIDHLDAPLPAPAPPQPVETAPDVPVVRTRPVEPAGFGSAVPARRVTQAGRSEEVRLAGFNLVTAAPPTAPAPLPRPVTIDRPVEIIGKPSPEYTEEAKARKVEGTVTLDVEFAASGEVRVLQVVRGLGYGLDEAAVRAAARIRFRPAQSSGRDVDCRATVHIMFRLS